jgi:outer membrane protein
MMRSVLLIGLSALLSTTKADAREISDKACIDAAQMVSLAQTVNPALEINRALVSETRADLMEAKSLRRPQVSAFASSSAGDRGLTERQIENQLGVRISQRVFDFGNAARARRAAELGLEGQEWNLSSVEDESVEAVLLAALSLSRLKQDIALLEERERYFAQFAERQRILLREGATTLDALASIEARLEDARAQMSENRLRQLEVGFSIGRILGEDSEPCPISEVGEIKIATGLVSIEGQDIDTLLGWSPTLKRLRAEIARAEEELSRERRARLPSLDLVAIGSYAYDTVNEDWEFRDRLGVDFSVPLYTGNALGARSDRASARLQRLNGEYARARQDIRLRIIVTRQRIATMAEVASRRQIAASSKESEMQATQTAFSMGQRTLSELLETRLGLYEAQSLLLDAEFSLLQEYVRLATLTASYPAAH